MNRNEAPFQFTLASLFRVTLFTALALAMFTLPNDSNSGWMAIRGLAGFGFCGAAIGSLFGRAGHAALLVVVAIMLYAVLTR